MSYPNDPWPFYFAHRDARCFACKSLLVDLRSSGYAPGHGAYRGDCLACRARGWCDVTWYDCAESGPELISLNEYRAGRPELFPEEFGLQQTPAEKALIADAAEAQERFGDDELERFAALNTKKL